jgi:hypothetical protein
MTAPASAANGGPARAVRARARAIATLVRVPARLVRAWAIATLALCVAMPATAAEPTPARSRDGVVRASLAIDASELGSAAATVQERIRVRSEALLRGHDVLPARGADDPIIAIAVAPLPSEPGYRCTFAVRRGEAVVEGTEGTSLCQLCTEDELVDHIEAAIERVVPQIPASAATPARPHTRDPGPPRPRAAELRGLGKGGLAAAIGGGVLLGVGVGLAVRDAPPLAGDTGERASTRTAGIAVASIAGALLVAGLVMVVVDMRRGRAATGQHAWRRGGPSSRTAHPRRAARVRAARSL